MTTYQRGENSQLQDIQGQEGGRELKKMHQEDAVATDYRGAEAKPCDIVLTCVIPHNMLRSHQGGGERPPTPADDIQPPHNHQGEQRENENFRKSLREAKYQRYLLKDYLNDFEAMTGQVDRV